MEGLMNKFLNFQRSADFKSGLKGEDLGNG